jgi:RNA polymerase sigma-70 factor (ECF subfamily)
MMDRSSVHAFHRSGHQATPADLRLIAELRAGIEAAYKELLFRIEKVVAPLAAGLTVVRSDKDDLVQNVALKVFVHISGFRNECAFNSWIYRIAVNEIYSHGRWLTRRGLREISRSADNQGQRPRIENISDPTVSPFFAAAERQFNRQITAALSNLPPVCQEVFVLRAIGELTYKEIARRLSLPLTTVRSRIFTARQQLRSSCLLQHALHVRQH